MIMELTKQKVARFPRLLFKVIDAETNCRMEVSAAGGYDWVIQRDTDTDIITIYQCQDGCFSDAVDFKSPKPL